MYFENYPLVSYTLPNGSKIIMTNILKRMGFLDDVKKYAEAFIDYRLTDDDRPDIMAHRLYGDSGLHWIILLFNDIYDLYYDWPMTDAELYEYCVSKYGAENINALNHYETPDGHTVDVNHPAWDRFTVSNFETEERINEEKRKVKILDPVFAQAVENEFNKAINQ